MQVNLIVALIRSNQFE